MKYVYLGGPITGLIREEANDWRAQFEARGVWNGKWRGINPLRNEPVIPPYPSIIEGMELRAKNRFDVGRCDLMVAYMPTISIGTLLEIGWANELNKPVILVSDNSTVYNHPVLRASVGWWVRTLEGARVLINGLI